MKTERTIDDAIFDFIYNAALNDATRRVYKGEKKEVEKIDEAKNIVRKYVDNILSGNDYDFYETAKAVQEVINRALPAKNTDDKYFTFGNTQKLINMTAKYFYILSYGNDKENFKNLFSECHCPMDRIMIKNARKLTNTYKNSTRINSVLESELSWSKLDNDKNKYEGKAIEIYNTFQDIIREECDKRGIIPIEYDFLEWNNDEQ